MKIAILGFGREGKAAYDYWMGDGNEIVIHDNNESLDLPDDARSVLGKEAFDNLDQYNYDLIVRSPGMRVVLGSIKTPITTSTSEFIKKCEAPIIGVTGSKGKGTTSTLIYKILQESGYNSHLVGNIGTPALDELKNIKSKDIIVYEMSSFQLYDIDTSPHVAVCLMVTEDHLDWHQDLEEYRSSKGNIFKFQNENDVAVHYSDNKVSTELAKLSKAKRQYSYGENANVGVEDGWIVAFGNRIIETSKVALPGEHNIQNICAAIAGVWTYTQDIESIKRVLTTFIGLPYHIELVKEKDGIRYYNDSFSTNPTSAIAAVKSFEEPKVLFLGGFNKETSFNELATELTKTKVKKVIAYGQTGKKIEEALNNYGIDNVEYMDTKDFNKIIRAGLETAKTGDVVVFSPGCASFDMFKDYLDRGNAFNDVLNNLL